jgi:hypothetical protein
VICCGFLNEDFSFCSEDNKNKKLEMIYKKIEIFLDDGVDGY